MGLKLRDSRLLVPSSRRLTQPRDGLKVPALLNATDRTPIPGYKRQMVLEIQNSHGVSRRLACSFLSFAPPSRDSRPQITRGMMRFSDQRFPPCAARKIAKAERTSRAAQSFPPRTRRRIQGSIRQILLFFH